jgi:hypothetical protein
MGTVGSGQLKKSVLQRPLYFVTIIMRIITLSSLGTLLNVLKNQRNVVEQ